MKSTLRILQQPSKGWLYHKQGIHRPVTRFDICFYIHIWYYFSFNNFFGGGGYYPFWNLFFKLTFILWPFLIAQNNIYYIFFFNSRIWTEANIPVRKNCRVNLCPEPQWLRYVVFVLNKIFHPHYMIYNVCVYVYNIHGVNCLND